MADRPERGDPFAGAAGSGGGPGSRLPTGSDWAGPTNADLSTTKPVLLQLCGELLLQSPPARPSTAARSNATIGLELLDLLLNPDHVQRITEELNLRNTLTLERSVWVDISLDRLSRQQENGASQVSALVSGRLGLDEDGRAGPQLLWLPLDTVPRPISVAVTASDASGTPLPRPPQSAVRRALASALDHILLASLRAHPEAATKAHPVGALLRDNSARWLLQNVLQSVAELGATTHRAYERLQALRDCHSALDPADLTSVDLGAVLTAVASAEQSSPAGRTASQLVKDVLVSDGPFLELLRLVHEHYFVVAGVDPTIRNQIVRYDLPEADAIAEPSLRTSYRRMGGGLDPREHSYCARIKVPLPDNVDEYNLYVQATSKNAPSPSDVSLIGVIHFGGHPARSSLEALTTCAAHLDATAAAATTGSNPNQGEATGGNEKHLPLDDRVARKLAYIASQAAPALDRMEVVAEQQNRAADELEARSGLASVRLVRQLFGGLRRTATTARNSARQARDGIDEMLTSLRQQDVRPEQVRQTTTAVRAAVEAMDQPLLASRLVSSELTGREIGRIRLSRSRHVSPNGARPRTLEIWATVTDASRPYAPAALGPPFGLMVLVYLTGAVLFDTLTWPFAVSRLTAAMGGVRQAGTIVGVLLLVPSFALTRLKLPDRLSVSGRLHRPGRLFVVVAIATLGATSVVVAAFVGGQPPAHPHIVLWTLRTALGVFVICSLWAALAATLRERYSWRPKGLSELLDLQPAAPSGRRPPQPRWSDHAGRVRAWPANLCRYDRKPPDAEFDLTRAGDPPWRLERP